MSFDPNQNQPPMGHVPPKKSGGALKWILGGIGCFGLITVLCIGGIFYWGYGLAQNMVNNPALLEGKAKLENSAALGEAVGNPVSVGPQSGFKQTQNGQRFELEYEFGISGPNGSGTATINVEGNPMSKEDWNLLSVAATVNGEDVPLEEDGLDINIEGEEGE